MIHIVLSRKGETIKEKRKTKIKMIKKQLCFFTMCLALLIMAPSCVSAQDDNGKGIKWITGLSWEQIRQKAKAENKYIFIDAYTTWCGPCKAMDKNVFISDSVGDFFNKRFISVKVQIDKTQKDNEEIKKWYDDAVLIAKENHIEAYPTFLFFTPDGQIVEKQTGYKQVSEFISMSQEVMKPGKTYDDPYSAYDRNLSLYHQGIKDYSLYPSMIKIADKLGDTAVSEKLSKELTDYASALTPKERYTKELIEYWASYIYPSTSRTFGFFQKDGRLIDKVMKSKGFAARFIDRTIQAEIALPFLQEEAKRTGISMTGMHLTASDMKADLAEADWGKLDSIIQTAYGKDYAKRNVLTAKLEWYNRHSNYAALINCTLERLNCYPAPDVKDWNTTHMINGPAWDAFLTSNDKRILKSYAKWMKKVIENWPRDNYIDTYANLLYKLGDTKNAIKWQQRAIEISPMDESYLDVLNQMKRGEPTYLNQGAVWKRK